MKEDQEIKKAKGYGGLSEEDCAIRGNWHLEFAQHHRTFNPELIMKFVIYSV